MTLSSDRQLHRAGSAPKWSMPLLGARMTHGCPLVGCSATFEDVSHCSKLRKGLLAHLWRGCAHVLCDVASVPANSCQHRQYPRSEGIPLCSACGLTAVSHHPGAGRCVDEAARCRYKRDLSRGRIGSPCRNFLAGRTVQQIVYQAFRGRGYKVVCSSP